MLLRWIVVSALRVLDLPQLGHPQRHRSATQLSDIPSELAAAIGQGRWRGDAEPLVSSRDLRPGADRHRLACHRARTPALLSAQKTSRGTFGERAGRRPPRGKPRRRGRRRGSAAIAPRAPGSTRSCLGSAPQADKIGRAAVRWQRGLAATFPAVRLTVTDIDEEMVASARRGLAGLSNITVQQADVTSLPFPSARFDAGTSYMMLHRVLEAASCSSSSRCPSWNPGVQESRHTRTSRRPAGSSCALRAIAASSVPTSGM